MNLGLTDRVCLVTGSTAGIGLETVRILAAEGARVVVTGRSEEGVAKALDDAGAALGIACDLSRPEEPARVVAEVTEKLGAVECLVNNVGSARQVGFEDLTEEDWEAVWQLNVMSYVRSIRAVVPAMRERGSGRIVNVSSTAGKRPSTGMPDYTVSKAAVLSLSRLVADLYAKDGILCNAVAPGPTLSPAWLGEGGLADQAAEQKGILARGGSRRGREGPPARAHGRAAGDRRRDRVSVLRPRQLRDGSRLERGRRHRPGHHLDDRSTICGPPTSDQPSSLGS